MRYRHLTMGQRYQIAALHRAGFSRKHIAEAVECHPSTIGRELRRKRSGKAYVGSLARGQGQMKPEQAEIARQKKEVAKLKIERD